MTALTEQNWRNIDENRLFHKEIDDLRQYATECGPTACTFVVVEMVYISGWIDALLRVRDEGQREKPHWSTS